MFSLFLISQVVEAKLSKIRDATRQFLCVLIITFVLNWTDFFFIFFIEKPHFSFFILKTEPFISLQFLRKLNNLSVSVEIAMKKVQRQIYGGPQQSHQIQIAHIKFKSLTSNSNRSHQIQNAHIKFKSLTSNSNRSHQIQIAHMKFKSLTSNSNYSHQIQIAHIKFKSLTSNSNRVSDWSAAKSMNTILSFHSLFHFTAILCDRYLQCMLSVYSV